MSLFCSHAWRPRKAHQIAEYSDLARQSDMPADHKTEVLYVCEKCGKPKVKSVKGSWRFDELFPSPSSPEALKGEQG